MKKTLQMLFLAFLLIGTSLSAGEINKRVSKATDDYEERSSGSMDTGSSDLEMTKESSTQTIGIRFNQLNIPKGATITKAYIQFTADEKNGRETNLNITTEDSSYAATFSSERHNISNRSTIDQDVSWNVPNWYVIGEQSESQRTPDLKDIIQPIVNKSGWNQGNAIVFIITGDGKRVAESYEGDSSAAAKLYVEYTDTPMIYADKEQFSANEKIKIMYENTNHYWIGIFKKQATNNWDNLLIGRDDIVNDGFFIIDEDDAVNILGEGEFEARLFSDYDFTLANRFSFNIGSINNGNFGDEKYVYQDNELNYWIDDSKKRIGIWSNGADLIVPNTNFFKEKHGNIGEVNYTLERKIGGFDVVYTIPIKNSIDKNNKIISLQIPGIKFNSGNTLNILNPLYKHYLETRNLDTEKDYFNDNSYWNGGENKSNKNYFPIAHQLRTIENKTYILAEEAYGTQFVYSPVIVAANNNMAVGSSLLSNFIEYGIGAKMYIDKNNDSWTYRYDLIAFKDLKKDDEIKITIPVRFSAKKNWIFTLYPYKEFFNSNYEKDADYLQRHPKDVRPIQGIAFSYPDKDSTDGENRNWAYILAGENNTLLLEKVLNTFGELLKQKGYKRSMIWNFTGTYSRGNFEGNCTDKLTYHDCLHEQLPFQFLGNPYLENENILQPNFKNAMIKILNNDYEENSGLAYLRQYGIGYDWGISGQVPVKEDGSPISSNQFRPHHLAYFTYGEGDNYDYAKTYLEQVPDLSNTFFEPKFIRLDALNRMSNVKSKIAWVQKIKRELPNTKLAPESSIDYMHSQAGIINQLDSTESFKGDFDEINQPDFLAIYLNPGMENIVNLDNQFLSKSIANRDAYVWKLAKLGYTPLVKYHSEEFLNFREDNGSYYRHVISESNFDINKDINMSAFTSVHGLTNEEIDECLDNDGNNDWPYDEACREKDFSQ